MGQTQDNAQTKVRCSSNSTAPAFLFNEIFQTKEVFGDIRQQVDLF